MDSIINLEKRIRTRRLVQGAICIAGAAALSGCSFLETRPGHPKSSDNGYYYNDWSKNACGRQGASGGATPPIDATDSAKSRDSSGDTMPASDNSPYNSSNVSRDVCVARGYAHKMARHYEAAEHHAQDVADELSVPILGGAAAAVGAAVFSAGTTALSAAGLGGGTFGAANLYMHPEEDAATNRTAAQQLMCVVDSTQSIKNRDVKTLLVDRTALRYAMIKLQQAAKNTLQSTKTDSTTVANKSAINTVLSAGENALSAVDDEIDNYNQLVVVIYKTTDKIDFSARNAGARAVDYSSVRDAIATAAQSAASTQTATQAAQTQLSAAATTANTGTAAMLAPPTINTTEARTILGASAGNEPDDDDSDATPSNSPPPGGTGTPSAATPLTPTTEQRLAVITAPTSAMTKVVELAQMALDDLPKTTFANIAGNVAACAVSGS